MLFAQQVWNSGDAGCLNLAGSPIFQTQLAGPKNAVREFWGIPKAHDSSVQNGIWKNVLLMASADRVHEALQDEERVYLTHINTPRQVVIAGDPDGCQRVIDRLQCPALRAPFDHVLHCPPVRLEFDELVELHDFDTRPPVNGVRLYSAAEYAPVHIDRISIARSITETLCTHLDFPRLINRVYEDGARLFIELGAGSNCSKWIDDTLKGRPHLAVSINRKGADDFTSIVRLLARLASHRVPMDISPLYPNPDRQIDESGLKKTIHRAQD
jgi:PfaB family protein